MLNALANGETLAIVVALEDLASTGLKKIDANIAAMGKTAQANSGSGGIGSLGGALKGMINPTTMAIGAVVALGGVLGESMKAAADEQQSISLLTASLQANVPGWLGNTAAIESYITSAEHASAFSKDDLRLSLETLVGATHDVAKAERDQTTATNLARYAHEGLDAATQQIVAVEAGRYRGLAQLGINIKHVHDSQQALNLINQVAAGQDSAYLGTEAGQMDALNNTIHDLEVELGQKLLPVFEKLLRFINDNLIPGVEALGNVWDSTLSILTGGLFGLSPAMQQAQRDQEALAQSINDTAAAAIAVHASDISTPWISAFDDIDQHASETKTTVDKWMMTPFTDIPPKIAAAKQKAKSAIAAFGVEVGAATVAAFLQIENTPLISLKNLGDATVIKELEAKRAEWEKILRGSQTIHSTLGINAANDQINLIDLELTALEPTASGHPHMATGGYWGAGEWSWVGENGPELRLSTGASRVFSHAQSMAMAGGQQSSTVVHTHIYLDGRQIAEVVDRHMGKRLALMGTSALGGFGG